MRDLVMLIGIVCYMIFVTTIFSFMGSDPSLAALTASSSQNLSIDGPGFNISSAETEGVATPIGIFSALRFMFLWDTPFSGIPLIFTALINIIDYLVVLIGIILVYRLVRSGAG